MGGRHGSGWLSSAPGPLMAASLTAGSPHGRSPHGQVPETDGPVLGSIVTGCPPAAMAVPSKQLKTASPVPWPLTPSGAQELWGGWLFLGNGV